MIQYSRAVHDGIEKPQRTGYPRFAWSMTTVCGTTLCASPATTFCGRRLAMAASRPERGALPHVARVFAVARIVQRGGAIFLALAPEFFLGGFEICHARGDLFALTSAAVFFLGHAHPLFESCPARICLGDWAAN